MAQQDPLIGKQLGNYRIERLLGQGGMARVYFGWDIRLHRPVAIKVIDDQFRADPAYQDRFIREARAVATWNHPNILQIYTAGEEGGFPYFAMEYIRGMDLGQLLRRYAQAGELMSYRDVLVIARAVANALDYAHRKGVIHRDVKPSNVLISEDDHVVLTDFGLAMIVSEGTMGKVFGSPHYMSPEQARNSANAVPQSDLYSLGVMLYEMMVGSLPFEDASPASLAIQHIIQAPPAPREINPGINPALEAVLLKSLSKIPQERYENAGELVDALEEAIAENQDADENVPSTLPDLPSVSGSLTQLTLSYVQMAGGTMTTLGELPPLSTPAPAVGVPVAKSERQPLSARKWAGIGIGCLAVFLVVSLALVLGIAFALSRQAASLPMGLLRGTPTPSRLPALARTITARAQAPAFTFTAPPTSTTIPSITPTSTPTQTPTPASELIFLSHKDDSLFIIFHGPGEFPLGPLELKGEKGKILGEEWEVEFLKDGECVTAWKDKGKAETPKGAECSMVGEKLTREGPERFWTGSFEVYYDGKLVGVCRSAQENEGCKLQITPGA